LSCLGNWEGGRGSKLVQELEDHQQELTGGSGRTDVNAQDDMLMTSLHYAAATDSLEITTLLLEAINIALADEDKLRL
jgi:hypothetical protein